MPVLPKKILLPNDIKRQGQLRSKLKEYRERLKGIVDSRKAQDALYKIAVLEHLLLDGSVVAELLIEEMKQKDKESFNMPAFSNAYLVIEEYCKTGGVYCSGGTGLPAA